MEVFFDKRKHPKIKIKVKGARQIGTLEAIVDTGFDGHLSLPVNIAVPLGLELIGVEEVQYADGRISKELVFSVRVNLDGKEKIVPATLTGGNEALAGTSLFDSYELCFNFAEQRIVSRQIE